MIAGDTPVLVHNCNLDWQRAKITDGGVDVVENHLLRFADGGPLAYSARAAPAKVEIQDRVVAFVHDVLHAIGFNGYETDHHSTGDGIVLFLPPTAQVHLALHQLLRTSASWLEHDSTQTHDRMRLRMAAVIGPVGPSALGFSGTAAVQCSRLLDSQVLRNAMAQHTAADLAVLVSESLYTFVVVEGHPGLDPNEFRSVTVRTKNFKARPWLWMAPAQRPRRFAFAVS